MIVLTDACDDIGGQSNGYQLPGIVRHRTTTLFHHGAFKQLCVELGQLFVLPRLDHVRIDTTQVRL